MRVYLDNAAGTRMSDKVIGDMLRAFGLIEGNASSVHRAGMEAREMVEESRERIAKCFRIEASRIVFTSGATEANNSAMSHYAAKGNREGKRHIVISSMEHPSITEYCRYLSDERGYEITVVEPTDDGVIRSEDVIRALRRDTCVVSVMGVNNEIGTIQPFEEIGRLCSALGVPFHCDMTQGASVAHRIYNMEGASFSFSAHKIHGPQGVGILIVPSGLRHFQKFIHGGNQERGLRAGTENVAGIVGMASAIAEGFQYGFWKERIEMLRDRLYQGLCKEVGGVVLNGNYNKSVPHILNVSFEGIEGDAMVTMLSNVYEIYCSTGSACCSGNTEPSRVLKSMGLSDARSLGAVRLSLSQYNTCDQIDYTIKSISEAVSAFR